jgi:hypothetical protein
MELGAHAFRPWGFARRRSASNISFGVFAALVSYSHAWDSVPLAAQLWRRTFWSRMTLVGDGAMARTYEDYAKLAIRQRSRAVLRVAEREERVRRRSGARPCAIGADLAQRTSTWTVQFRELAIGSDLPNSLARSAAVRCGSAWPSSSVVLGRCLSRNSRLRNGERSRSIRATP